MKTKPETARAQFAWFQQLDSLCYSFYSWSHVNSKVKMGVFSAFNQYLISTQLALHNRSWPKLAVREPSRGVLGLCVIIYRRINRTAHEVDREGVFEQTSSYPAKTLTAAGGAHRGDCIPCALQNVVPSPEA